MLSFLLITALINNSFADDYHSPYHHEKELHHDEYDNQNMWMVNPKIVICENMTDFTVSQVKYSISALKKSSMTKSVERRNTCDYNHEFGIIKIVDAKTCT